MCKIVLEVEGRKRKKERKGKWRRDKYRERLCLYWCYRKCMQCSEVIESTGVELVIYKAIPRERERVIIK